MRKMPCVPGRTCKTKAGDGRIRDPKFQLVAARRMEVGFVEEGLAEADVVHEGDLHEAERQQAPMETHCAMAWQRQGGKL